MDPREVLRTKRDGGALSRAQIEAFMKGYVAGEVPDPVASALLMAIFQVGMRPDELFHWTRAMLESGERLDLAGIDGPFVDKHSTGGVGDKVSIPLAPALAACGVRVPMVSGRGLGHTAGTLDKLEAIEGFSTELSRDGLRGALERTGVAFAAQTAELVPADRGLYALRDATGLVESIPLIASSILSKKLAEGLDALVLDVKFGSGAFLADEAEGAELARRMLGIARRFELPAVAYRTAMDRPLGRAVGHALEIAESVECLRGEGPADLRELVVTLGGELLRAAGVAANEDEGRAMLASRLDDGTALARFERIVAEQGGDPRCLEDPAAGLPRAPDVARLEATETGALSFVDCRAVGLALCALGGGRASAGDTIDPAVGILWRRETGDEVRPGDLLAEVHHRGGHGLDEALSLLRPALRVGERIEPAPLIRERMTL